MSNLNPAPAEPPSAGRLLRSTAIAVVVAAFILATVVLPAEYGVDPTGLGRVLGLTQMGEVKARLAAEAAADAAADAQAAEEDAAERRAVADSSASGKE